MPNFKLVYIGDFNPGFTSTFELITMGDCICPGATIVYECNVTRGGLTVFQGSALNCSNSNNELTLTHNLNSNRSSTRSCNGGAIVAKTNSNRQDHFSFSSTLTVTLNDNVMALKDISCSFDNGSVVSAIGSYYIPTFTGITMSVKK